MESKVYESASLESGTSLEQHTLEIILVRAVFAIIIVATSMSLYALFINVKLHLMCNDVKCLYSTSTGITVNEYNNLVDKIDSEGYTLSYTVEKNSSIISEKSGKIDSAVPLASGDELILTFTHKVDGNNTDAVGFKEYLSAEIK
jgi:hypothetical protein